MKTTRLVLSLLLLLPAGLLHASWKEPWMDTVIKKADHFILAKVKSDDAQKGVVLQVMKTLAGEPLKGEITLDGFYALAPCFSSEDAALLPVRLERAELNYFFLKGNGKSFQVATPTTGFAPVMSGRVAATYSHSLQIAQVQPSLYEQTMTAIFNHYHGLPFEEAAIRKTITGILAKNLADVSDKEFDKLMNDQHVALETIHHLRLQGLEETVLSYMSPSTDNFLEFSAARALVASNTTRAKDLLVNALTHFYRPPSVKLMCVWTLQAFRPTELKDRLKALEWDEDVHSDYSRELYILEYHDQDPRAACSKLPPFFDALQQLVRDLEADLAVKD